MDDESDRVGIGHGASPRHSGTPGKTVVDPQFAMVVRGSRGNVLSCLGGSCEDRKKKKDEKQLKIQNSGFPRLYLRLKR